MMQTYKFLPKKGCFERKVYLSKEEKEKKRDMINCFTTQKDFLFQFPLEIERFRKAPEYDYTNPPHEGKLFYEHFDWGVNGEQWRRLAKMIL